jgi:hypothetical protein
VIADDSMQPDVVVYDLISSHFHGPLVVGDLKGEDRKEDSHDYLVDLLRIGMISGESINKNNYDGVVGVHVVGLQFTFYIITLMANGIYVMLEICSVSLPRDFTELKFYIATMEDILLVIHYYSQCSPSPDPSWFEQNKKKMLQESLFFNMINCGKSKKRLCNLVLNHYTTIVNHSLLGYSVFESFMFLYTYCNTYCFG